MFRTDPQVRRGAGREEKGGIVARVSVITVTASFFGVQKSSGTGPWERHLAGPVFSVPKLISRFLAALRCWKIVCEPNGPAHVFSRLSAGIAGVIPEGGTGNRGSHCLRDGCNDAIIERRIRPFSPSVCEHCRARVDDPGRGGGDRKGCLAAEKWKAGMYIVPAFFIDLGPQRLAQY